MSEFVARFAILSTPGPLVWAAALLDPSEPSVPLTVRPILEGAGSEEVLSDPVDVLIGVSAIEVLTQGATHFAFTGWFRSPDGSRGQLLVGDCGSGDRRGKHGVIAVLPPGSELPSFFTSKKK